MGPGGETTSTIDISATAKMTNKKIRASFPGAANPDIRKDDSEVPLPRPE